MLEWLCLALHYSASVDLGRLSRAMRPVAGRAGDTVVKPGQCQAWLDASSVGADDDRGALHHSAPAPSLHA